MTYPLLPAGVIPHEPLNDFYAVKLPNPYLRGEYEQGLARQVKKYRRAPTTFAIKWPLEPAQFEILCGWLEDAAGGLGGWFDLNVFRGDSYQRMSVRFIMPLPDPAREGGEWMWSGQIETMDWQPRDPVTTGAAILTFGTDDSVEDVSNRLHHILHIDLRGALLW